MKRIIALVLPLMFVLAIFSFTVSADDEQVEGPPEIGSRYAVVYNLEAKKNLYEKGADSIIYPASLAKIMTGMLACEYYESRGGNFNVTVTETALENVKGNKIGLKAGESVPFYDLIIATLIGSGNDAAYVIAETVGGSVEGFVAMMNERAQKLGALHTTYSNPSGYHSPHMLTTLNDQALICASAAENKLLLELSSLIDYKMAETNMSQNRTFTNQNLLFDPNHWLLHYTPNTKGLNVGMTQEAGWCMATVYDDDGLTHVAIVSGGSVDGFEYKYMNDVKSIIAYASEGYAFKQVLAANEVLYDVDVALGDENDRMILVSEKEITALLPSNVDINNDITVESVLNKETFEAPVSAGDVFGSVKVFYKNELLGEVNLVAMTNIERSTSLFVFDRISDFFSNRYVKAILLFLSSVLFALFVAAFIYVCIKRRKRLQEQRRARAHKVTHARKNV